MIIKHAETYPGLSKTTFVVYKTHEFHDWAIRIQVSSWDQHFAANFFIQSDPTSILNK